MVYYDYKKNYTLIEKLFTDIMGKTECDYLLANLRSASLNSTPTNPSHCPLSDDNMFINTDDVQNTIYFNPEKLMLLINCFKEDLLIKHMFKNFRKQNIESSSVLSGSKPTKLRFDDMGFYRCERQRKYRRNNGPEWDLRRYYASYFALGVVSDSQIKFTNKINDVVVDILELTNGRF